MPKKNAKFAMMEKLAREKGNTTMGEYFIKDGLDYKGQEQHAWSVNGYGAGFDVKIDPGKLYGLTAAIGVTADLTRSKEVMLVAQVGPALVRYTGVDGGLWEETMGRPITLTCMEGVMWEGKAGASFDIGVGFSAAAGVAVASGASSKTESTFDAEEDEEEEPVFDPEVVGASFEAFAGFKASASYTYTNIALEDVWPSFFGVDYEGAEKSDLKLECEEIFTLGSRKDAIREKAVAFMNRHQGLFGAQKTSSFLFWDRSAASITEALMEGARVGRTATRAQRRVRAIAQNWASKLRPYTGGVRQRGLNTLVLTSHAPEGQAGFEASIKASASLGPIAGADVSATLRGPTVKGQGKWSSYRFQTFWPIDDGDQLLMYTQETKISYWAVDLTLISVEAKAEASAIDVRTLGDTARSIKTMAQTGDIRAFEAPKKLKFSTEDIRGKEEGNVGFSGVSSARALALKKLAKDGLGIKKQWNSMSYQSACIYWARPEAERNCVGAKAVELPGTGFSLGRSTTLSSLQTLRLAFWDESESAFMEGSSPAGIKLMKVICSALHIHPKRLSEALWDSNIGSLIADLASSEANVDAEEGEDNDSLALLIEVAFAVPMPEFDIEVRNKKYWGHGETLPESEWVAKFDGEFMSKAAGNFNHKTLTQLDGCLQSLRIRLRMADVENSDSNFQLGFKIGGQDLAIRLNKVDRAGCAGVIDLATYWFPRGMRTGGAVAYEQAVPKVALFDQ